MGLDLLNDFVVDLNEHCFLCLKQIQPAKPKAELGIGSIIYSLQYLSQFLKMNLAKILEGKLGAGLIPQLRAKMDKSRLKVTLCGGCAYLTEEFSVLYRQLEKTEMEMNFCLNNIHRNMLEAEETGRSKEFRSISDSEAKDNLEIVELLRKETMQKCSDKLRVITPKVRIQKYIKKKEKAMTTRRKPAPVASYQMPTGNDESLFSQSTDTNLVTTELPKSILNPKTRKYFKCGLCPKECGSRITLQDHFKGAHLQQKYKCVRCSREYTYRPDLVRHLRIYHKNGKKNGSRSMPKRIRRVRKQTIKKLATGQNENVLSQTNDAEHQEPFPVLKTLTTTKEIILKSIFNSNTKKHKCSLCPREYCHVADLRDHYKGYHYQQKYKCEKCHKEFTFRRDILRHLRSAHKNGKKNVPSSIPKRNCPVGKKTIENLASGQKESPSDIVLQEPFPVVTARASTKHNIPKIIFNSKTKKQKCSLCPREYCHLADLRDHYKGYHFQQKYKCERCPKEFMFRRDHSRHVRTMHNNAEKIARMKKNGMNFVSRKNLSKHHSHQSTSTNRAPKEESQGLQLDSVKEISRTVGKVTIMDSTYTSDFQVKNGEKLRILPKSHKKVRWDLTSIKQHNTIGENNSSDDEIRVPCISSKYDKYTVDPSTQLYRCKKCPREYKLRSSVHRHYNAAHLNFHLPNPKVQYGGGRLRLKCHKCDGLFDNSLKLQYHQRTTCNGATINSLSQSHPNISTNKNRFPCSICKLRFSQEQYLKRHVETAHSHLTKGHSQNPIQPRNPPFFPKLHEALERKLEKMRSLATTSSKTTRSDIECEPITVSEHDDWNEMEFPEERSENKSNETVNSTQVPTGSSVKWKTSSGSIGQFDLKSRKHCCSICSKEFASIHVWKIHHMSAHLKVRFTCKLCGKLFTQSSSYHRHQRDVHNPVKSLKCHVCNYACRRKDNLRKHLRGVHSVEL